MPSLDHYPSVLISHSPDDHLISDTQSLALQSRLIALGYPSNRLRYEGDRLGKDGEDGKHDEVLKTRGFGELVKEWVERG